MEQKVTVLTPNGRRHNIKVTPNTTLLQILEETCRKHGFNSDNYFLTHHNREVGLTQIFRFSGLPNNCLLEMAELPPEKKRVAEKVEICVQLEDGTRKLGKFESSESVWNVLESLNAEAAGTFDNPVVLYMRQEISGRNKISETTLKSLGIIEGRALFRFLNKKPEELKTQASVYVPPTKKETDESLKEADPRDATKRAVTGGGGGGGGFAITKDLVKALKPKPDALVATAMEDDEPVQKDNEKSAEEIKPKYDWGTGQGRSMVKKTNDGNEGQDQNEESTMEVEPQMNILGERNAILYSMNTMQREMEELPDSFYDLTVNDLKLVLRDLKRIANGNEDAPLLTEKLRELEQNKTMLNKIAHYKNCIIRIQFPDRHVLQGVFKPSENVQHIVDFVRQFMLKPERSFSLFTIPPKTILPLDKNLLELDLIPTAVVHFTLDGVPEDNEENLNVLKPEFLTQLTSIEGAIYAAKKLRLMHRSTEVDISYEDDRPGPSTGAIPKRPRSDK